MNSSRCLCLCVWTSLRTNASTSSYKSLLRAYWREHREEDVAAIAAPSGRSEGLSAASPVSAKVSGRYFRVRMTFGCHFAYALTQLAEGGRFARLPGLGHIEDRSRPHASDRRPHQGRRQHCRSTTADEYVNQRCTRTNDTVASRAAPTGAPIAGATSHEDWLLVCQNVGSTALDIGGHSTRTTRPIFGYLIWPQSHRTDRSGAVPTPESAGLGRCAVQDRHSLSVVAVQSS